LKVGVSDGKFAADNALTPFGWLYYGGSDFGATRSEQGLDLFAQTAMGGVVASQLMMLSEGRYKLITDGHARSGSSKWTVACAGSDQTALGGVALPTAAFVVGAEFTVPDACSAVWLRLIVRADSAAGGIIGNVREVRVDRLNDR
jgi:hypothetical protein